MTSALGYGLMGAAMGALKGAKDIWDRGQEEAKTSRLQAAKLREAESLAEIKARFESIQDERDFEQDQVLKSQEISAANTRAAASIESADRRAAASNDYRIRAAEISASRPRGEGSQSKAQLFHNNATGEQRWITPGDEIPAGFYRAPSSGAPKDADAEEFSKLRDKQRDRVTKMSPEELAYELELRNIMSTEPGADKRALADALTAEANEVYGLKRPGTSRAGAQQHSAPQTEPTIPTGAVPIGRSPDGRIVYRLDGQQVVFD